MVGGEDLGLLAASFGGGGGRVTVQVTGCAFSCCGRGWRRRAGYEQLYTGRVVALDGRGFVLVSEGAGSVGYVVWALLEDTLAVVGA
jgi:hypothetical protein